MCIAKILRYRRALVFTVAIFILLQFYLLIKSTHPPAPPEPIMFNGIPQGVWIQRTLPPVIAPEDDLLANKGPNIIIDKGIPKDRVHEVVHRRRFPEENVPNRIQDLPEIRSFNISKTKQSEIKLNLSICEGFQHQSIPGPMLTLFTSFSAESKQSWTIQNMLKNRALLSPLVRSIYYYVPNEKGVELFQRLAISCGFHVYPAPEVHEESQLPVLKRMWLHAQRVSKTEYYAYANADILFTQDLPTTLELLQTKSKYLNDTNYLVIGQRIDYKFETPKSIESLEEVSELATHGQRSAVDAQDYFISSKGHYPWVDIPNFVIGNVLYDNWIVMHAFINKMAVFDVTYTVTALHQSEKVTHPSRNRHHDDSINVLMAGNTTQMVLGMTKCAHFETAWMPGSSSNLPFLLAKRGKHSPCWFNFQKFGIDKDMFQTLIPYIS